MDDIGNPTWMLEKVVYFPMVWNHGKPHAMDSIVLSDIETCGS